MKTKKKVLIGLMSLCLLGGVGSALALTATAATGSINNNVDGAVYFEWGAAELPQISELKGSVPQYSYFTASTTSTKNVAGTVTINFTLSAQNKDAKTGVLTGLTITVKQVETAASSASDAATKYASGTQKAVLDATHLTGNATFAVAAGEEKHVTSAHYVVQFAYDGTNVGSGNVLSGQLALTSAFAAS